MLGLSKGPVVRTQMLIRRPVEDVFNAFVDPAVTTKFWFTRSSGPLVPGAHVRWDWEMYDVGADVTVHTVEPNQRIIIEWPDVAGMTRVEWEFVDRSDGTTLVTITNSGFQGDGDKRVSQAVDSAGGFAFVLAGLKAWMEHGIQLNLVADHFPRDA